MKTDFPIGKRFPRYFGFWEELAQTREKFAQRFPRYQKQKKHPELNQLFQSPILCTLDPHATRESAQLNQKLVLGLEGSIAVAGLGS